MRSLTMEHRCSERVDTDVRVLIYKAGAPQAIGRIKNGRKYRFFVETDFGDINIFQGLYAEMLLSQGSNQTTKYKYATRVIRKMNNGLGLELEMVTRDAGIMLTKASRSSRASQETQKLYGYTISDSCSTPIPKIAQVK